MERLIERLKQLSKTNDIQIIERPSIYRLTIVQNGKALNLDTDCVGTPNTLRKIIKDLL